MEVGLGAGGRGLELLCLEEERQKAAEPLEPHIFWGPSSPGPRPGARLPCPCRTYVAILVFAVHQQLDNARIVTSARYGEFARLSASATWIDYVMLSSIRAYKPERGPGSGWG